ncbi:unnamed protein product [Ambrosiozyma monospora]|uniref:Unnamed protein product n=1 Tax=Ambrosiozyma monospora TaxID=43982 RepID=A0A9W6YU38_AMBMO|nr:unnamed protein product [Ambrosiozyma monospora]
MVSLSNLFLLALSATSASAYKAVAGHYGDYSVVTGFFKQDDPSTNATTFDHHDNLGLHENLTWPEFQQQVEDLNANAPEGTTYKVIYYGVCFHNVATTYYGKDAWKCYWCQVNGNGTVFWGPDGYLTEKGEQFARNNSKLIRSLIGEGFPLPQSMYVSPLSRCGDTLVLTWGDLLLEPGYIRPIVKEGLREVIGVETPDLRRSKTYLKERYPYFDFEHGFAEEDQLFSKTEGGMCIYSIAIVSPISQIGVNLVITPNHET